MPARRSRSCCPASITADHARCGRAARVDDPRSDQHRTVHGRSRASTPASPVPEPGGGDGAARAGVPRLSATRRTLATTSRSSTSTSSVSTRRAKLQIESELRAAIVDGDLRAYLQPMVDLRDGTVTGSRRSFAGRTRRTACAARRLPRRRRSGRADDRASASGCSTTCSTCSIRCATDACGRAAADLDQPGRQQLAERRRCPAPDPQLPSTMARSALARSASRSPNRLCWTICRVPSTASFVAPPRRRDRPRRLRHRVLVAVVPAPAAADRGEDRPQLRGRTRRVADRRGDRRGGRSTSPTPSGCESSPRASRTTVRSTHSSPSAPTRRRASCSAGPAPDERCPRSPSRGAAPPRRAGCGRLLSRWTGAPTSCPASDRREPGCSWLRSTPRTTRSSSRAAQTPATADVAIVYVNAAFEKETGFRSRDVVGRSVDLLLPQPATGRLSTWFRQGLPRRRRARAASSCGGAPTTPRSRAAMTLSPIFDERGVLTHWLHVGRDITDGSRPAGRAGPVRVA